MNQRRLCMVGRFIFIGTLLLTALPVVSQSPSIFAPGIISSPLHDAAPAFTPDGKSVYFGRSNPSHSTILVSYLKHGQWSEPELAPFSGQWDDMEPAISPDGSFLVFVSNRPALGRGIPLDGH